MKAINPAYSYDDEHWAFLHPNPSRESTHIKVTGKRGRLKAEPDSDCLSCNQVCKLKDLIAK
ncbi:MAG: hypothetical protein II041_01465, partial [Bacteroidales bacterium]|nr:hypothetical protein [Bacteroidales bacterium]